MSDKTAASLQRGKACSAAKSCALPQRQSFKSQSFFIEMRRDAADVLAVPTAPTTTPAQLLETIQILQARVDRLQRATGQTGTDVLLRQPYAEGEGSGGSSGYSSPSPTETTASVQDPPFHIAATLIDRFLEAFAYRGYFFLEPRTFRAAAVLPQPFGHPDRPAPPPYTEDAFLSAVHHHLPRDVARFQSSPRIVLHTIQAEVLLSYYFLHAGRHLEGRQHTASAIALAITAGLHVLPPTSATQLEIPRMEAFPAFSIQSDALLPPTVDGREATERVNAWWSVWILNNYWVAADGGASAIPGGLNVDTPWPGSHSTSGSTITRFLSGNDHETAGPVALIARATTLLERTIAFSAHRTIPPDPNVFATFAQRLQAFHASLPAISGPGSNVDSSLLLAHVLTDLAAVRLHAPYAGAGPTEPGANPSRGATLCAAARIVRHLAGFAVDDVRVEPIVGVVAASIANLYITELAALRTERDPRRRAQAPEIELHLRDLMSLMALYAGASPITQQCFVDVSMSYSAVL
ncbi:hypothetical protein MIND_01166700 [Mycena indigotica]|uniref:Transcription factor domain-containing protein n=1 Tax=Mycena indigotica TaxID=2126181 RepID=A0A8H6S3V0_9AGAR|nr:uncharacterized protein MIND_01166700 [Mycena indigotica]KAF7292685.1 hypothetical protein MIND_01166700 [Mycena indigotica]